MPIEIPPTSEREDEKYWLEKQLLDCEHAIEDGRNPYNVVDRHNNEDLATIIPNRDDNTSHLRPKDITALMNTSEELCHPDDSWSDAPSNRVLSDMVEYIELETKYYTYVIGAMRDPDIPAPRFVIAGSIVMPDPVVGDNISEHELRELLDEAYEAVSDSDNVFDSVYGNVSITRANPDNDSETGRQFHWSGSYSNNKERPDLVTTEEEE